MLLTLRVTVIIVTSPHVVLRPPVEPELGVEGVKEDNDMVREIQCGAQEDSQWSRGPSHALSTKDL